MVLLACVFVQYILCAKRGRARRLGGDFCMPSPAFLKMRKPGIGSRQKAVGASEFIRCHSSVKEQGWVTETEGGGPPWAREQSLLGQLSPECRPLREAPFPK